MGSTVKDGYVYIIIDDPRGDLVKRCKERDCVSIQKIGQKQAYSTIDKAFTFDRDKYLFPSISHLF